MILDLNKLIEKYEIDIVGIIHIGAHHGKEYDVYKELVCVDNLLFFEPIPECYEVLKKNVQGIVVNKALGNYNGMAKLNLASNGQSSSLLEPALHVKQYPKITFGETIDVEIARLDDILTTPEKYNFISIDVQGYELEVFRGAMKTLEGIDCIISEVNRKELYKDCVQVDELDKFLWEFDFVRTDTRWVGRTWGDAFYTKLW